MEQTAEYVIRLSPQDRYRHVHVRVRGRIVFFRVQLETLVGKTWMPVVRYDTAHGFAHRDLLDKRGHAIKTPLFNQDCYHSEGFEKTGKPKTFYLNEFLVSAYPCIRRKDEYYKRKMAIALHHNSRHSISLRIGSRRTRSP